MNGFVRFHRSCLILLATLAIAVTGAQTAFAGVDVDINQGNVQPAPIAIPPFRGVDAKTQALGDDIVQVIAGNLERSGYFRPLAPAAMVEKNLDVNVLPRFADWKSVNAQYLVNGQVSQDADGRLQVDVRLWSVFNEQQLVGVQFTATADNWRRIAHKISDAVYRQLTGEDGYFDTRIVFVAESGARGKRISRLAIMDQDGANPSYLSDGGYIVMTRQIHRKSPTRRSGPTAPASICSISRPPVMRSSVRPQAWSSLRGFLLMGRRLLSPSRGTGTPTSS